MAAGRVKGITIEIGGDTTKLETSLKSVNQEIKGTESKLKDINKLLKMDPVLGSGDIDHPGSLRINHCGSERKSLKRDGRKPPMN